jgi:hypothetical protein
MPTAATTTLAVCDRSGAGAQVARRMPPLPFRTRVYCCTGCILPYHPRVFHDVTAQPRRSLKVCVNRQLCAHVCEPFGERILSMLHPSRFPFSELASARTRVGCRGTVSSKLQCSPRPKAILQCGWRVRVTTLGIDIELTTEIEYGGPAHFPLQQAPRSRCACTAQSLRAVEVLRLARCDGEVAQLWIEIHESRYYYRSSTLPRSGAVKGT